MCSERPHPTALIPESAVRHATAGSARRNPCAAKTRPNSPCSSTSAVLRVVQNEFLPSFDGERSKQVPPFNYRDAAKDSPREFYDTVHLGRFRPREQAGPTLAARVVAHLVRAGSNPAVLPVVAHNFLGRAQVMGRWDHGLSFAQHRAPRYAHPAAAMDSARLEDS